MQKTQTQLNIGRVEYNGLVWVNVEKPTQAEMDYLHQTFNFHPLSLDDCMSRIQLPKLDEFDSYIFIVLQFPFFNREVKLTVASQVAIYAGSNYVVTVNSGELRLLVKLFHDCEAKAELRKELMKRGSGYLLYRILDNLVDYCFPMLNKVIEQVDALEEKVLDIQMKRLVQELSIVRRDIIAYRRIVHPQIEVLELMERKEFSFLRLDPDIYFGDLADHMRRLWVELEDLKEVVEGLYDTHRTLTAHFVNNVVRYLTIIATVFWPILIITSLYAMNVPLPLQDSPAVFYFLLGAITLVTAGMLWLFFRRRWL